jgi:(1->4)-alpha-D-glucan 1-alpha-D-glucosylmutase
MSALTELAHRLGVETDYTDGLGRHHEVSPQALNAILATFGYADASEAKAEEALQSLGREERVTPQPPPRAYEPPELAAGQRVWVMAVQLYTVRSARNWGIGDFTDLRDLVTYAARMGAAGVALNPLHALFLDDPERASPYAPNSRLFLNTLYIDPEAAPDFTDAAMPARDRLAALRRAELIDYAGVAAAKRAAFEAMYARFHDHASAERRAAFDAYRQREAPALRHYATYEALRETMAARDPELAYWRRWPEEYRRPDAPGIASFVAEHSARIEFFEYLQWIADAQLAAAAQIARNARMPIGLYRDLAVGIDDSGADGWMYQDLLAQGFDAGAPPDPWSELGQCWGFPPVNPRALRADKYRMPSAVLRANMRHAGALRIDHILGLMRMFWIPPGGVPADGVYVRYPFEELIGVIAAESQQHCCLVVGEDLGSVPEGLRPALHAAGIYTSAVLYFERNETGFLAPSEYPVQAAASVTTHDLPTFAGWWEGRDIAARLALGRLSEQDAQRAFEERARLRYELMAAFAREDISAEPLVAVHRFLARTPSRIVSAQLADIVGNTEQVNLPGTHREYPNWRRKLPVMLDDAFADRRMGDVAAVIAAERPQSWADT